jgi:hypothetical protein
MPITSVNWSSRHSSRARNYRSKSKNADYFRKLDAAGIQAGREITEVKARMPITSVNLLSRHSNNKKEPVIRLQNHMTDSFRLSYIEFHIVN